VMRGPPNLTGDIKRHDNDQEEDSGKYSPQDFK
jgi:hypothetical protein